MVEMETNLQQARSSRQVSERSLNDCTLAAPSAGIIGSRMIEPGMNAGPEVPVFTLVRIDNVYARVAVPEGEISHIDERQNVSVTIGALNDTVIPGTVSEKGVIADPLSRTYTVKIRIVNSDERCRPGMACSALISSPDTVSSIVIPQYALLRGSDGPFCFVINASKTHALKRLVKIGTLTARGVTITDGLQEGEFVIVGGFQKLSDSSMVVCR
jgi:RND family efflux transporter MFP subunit